MKKNQYYLPAKDIYNFIPLSAAKDIMVLEASYRKKHPDVSKKFMVKSYFALHLILKGSGTLETPQGKFALKQNDIFIRFPNEKIAYYDLEEDPFSYIFVTFQGTLVNSYFRRIGISENHRVLTSNFELNKLFIDLIFNVKNSPETSDIISAGFINLILAKLSLEHSEKPQTKIDMKQSYITNAIDFVNANISNFELSATYVSQFLNLNTDYFLRIFKIITGTPFSKYIITLRMNFGIELMRQGETNISHISYRCGYETPAYFSKTFKEYFNETPKEHVQKNNK